MRKEKGKGKCWVEKELYTMFEAAMKDGFWESCIDYIELFSGFLKLSVPPVPLSTVTCKSVPLSYTPEYIQLTMYPSITLHILTKEKFRISIQRILPQLRRRNSTADDAPLHGSARKWGLPAEPQVTFLTSPFHKTLHSFHIDQ
jgi:hypothetical protein